LHIKFVKYLTKTTAILFVIASILFFAEKLFTDHLSRPLGQISLTASQGVLGNWTTYNGNLSRTGYDPTDPNFGTSVALSWKSPQLDGGLYAQPLIYGSIVIAATQNDTVYGLDGSTGSILWQNHLGTPVPGSWLPCGNIDPVGIISTPVIDPNTGELFLVGDIEGQSQPSAQHVMWTLNPLTGQLIASRVVDMPSMDTLAQLQRAALAYGNGYVYIGFGGNWGDCGNYHGWVVGAPESGNGPLISYQVPTQTEGGIWAPSGISIDSQGNVWVATGNGSSTTTYDEGDSVLELSPSLNLEQYFAPSNWASDNGADADLGSVGPLLLPGGYLFQLGKEYDAYLLSESSLGGIGGELASLYTCFSIGGDATIGSEIYVPCNDGVQEINWSTSPPSLSLGWKAGSNVIGPPIIAGGLVWSTDYYNNNLYGLNPSTGSVVVTLPTDPLEHFASPSAGNGMIYLGTVTGVEAFSNPVDISSVSPASGFVSTTTPVTIYGTGFTNVTAVNFGTSPAVSYNVVNSSEIQAVAPALTAAGRVDVRITTSSATSPLGPDDGFLYLNSGTFVGEAPVRIVDTRLKALDPPTYAGETLGIGQVLNVSVVGANSDNVPSNATSVVLNVTAVHPTAWSYLTIWPTGVSQPLASNLNFAPRESAIANMVQVPVGQGGQISIFNAYGYTDVLVDVEGYVTPGSGPTGLFNPVTPFRLIDTRTYSNNNFEDKGLTMTPGETITGTIAGTSIPSQAAYLAINLTATNTISNGGYLVAYPTGSSIPTGSLINYDSGESIANRVIVALNSSGSFSITNEVSTCDVIVDVTGYYNGAGLSSGYQYYPISPVRFVDTRTYSNNPYQGAGNTMVPGYVLTATIASSSYVPSQAVGITGNLAVTDTTSNGGYAVIWPTDSNMPQSSDINWSAGETIANAVITPLSSGGQVSFEVFNSNANLILDISGYYA
jgi:hypothetical protein